MHNVGKTTSLWFSWPAAWTLNSLYLGLVLFFFVMQQLLCIFRNIGFGNAVFNVSSQIINIGLNYYSLQRLEGAEFDLIRISVCYQPLPDVQVVPM